MKERIVDRISDIRHKIDIVLMSRITGYSEEVVELAYQIEKEGQEERRDKIEKLAEKWAKKERTEQ